MFGCLVRRCYLMEEDDGLLLNLAGTDSAANDVRTVKARSNPWIRKQERREKALVGPSLSCLPVSCSQSAP